MSREITRTIEFTIDSVSDVEPSVVDYRSIEFGMEIVFDKFIKGDKGDPPVRGVDYWTDSDVQEFKDYCVETITQQWFGTESQYESLYRRGEIHDDWIYFIYEDDDTVQRVVINGNTMLITKALLSQDGETLTLKGTIDGETLVLSGTIEQVQSFSISGDTLVSTGVLLSLDKTTIILQGTINGETLTLTNI